MQLMLGYRLIDTAQAYGNEEAVGEAIKRTACCHEKTYLLQQKYGFPNYGSEKAKCLL
ncbi:MAG: aldo/keto reductase [Thomasclavelia ramosa]